MGKFGCRIDGFLNTRDFSAPMPWIGFYVAGASLLCALAMASDFIHAIHSKKFWFPTKFFSLNATTLTIITVAIKLTVDLNTPMPSRVDQLAKLSSGVLICTVIANSMPSLGNMGKRDLMMNVIALLILVITVMCNIGIQLGTGVIYHFRVEHGVVLFLMFLILSVIIFSSVSVPTTKKHFEFKYKMKCDMVVKDVLDDKMEPDADTFRAGLAKLWMMAHTCSPQFVMARSVTCAATGALCLLSTVTLAEAMVRSYLSPSSATFCSGTSDYQESSILILFAQTIGIGVGTMGPAIRWFTAVNYRCPHLWKNCKRSHLEVENYWTEALKEMKECPVTLTIPHRGFRKLCFNVRNLFLNVCIGMQIGNVLFCKAIQLLSLCVVGQLVMFFRNLHFLKKQELINSGSDSQKILAMDLRQFVLHLEGEDALVDAIMVNNRDATVHWLRKGRKRASKHLEELIEKATLLQGLSGVIHFDSVLLTSVDYKESPNCWSLPIVNLTAIAIALPNLDRSKWQQLVSSLQEGLTCVKIVEDTLGEGEKMINLYRATQVVWVGVDLHQRWLDVDLLKLSIQHKQPREVLEKLFNAAKIKFTELKETLRKCYISEDPSTWNDKMLAANSMLRASKAIMQAYDLEISLTSDRLFDAIERMVSDMLCSCLVSFKRVIYMKCLNSTLETRENCIRDSVLLLGKMDKILNLLESRAPQTFNAQEVSSIKEWQRLYKLDSSTSTTESLELDDCCKSSPDDV